MRKMQLTDRPIKSSEQRGPLEHPKLLLLSTCLKMSYTEAVNAYLQMLVLCAGVFALGYS